MNDFSMDHLFTLVLSCCVAVIATPYIIDIIASFLSSY
jgi:hypothetical protein